MRHQFPESDMLFDVMRLVVSRRNAVEVRNAPRLLAARSFFFFLFLKRIASHKSRFFLPQAHDSPMNYIALAWNQTRTDVEC